MVVLSSSFLRFSALFRTLFAVSAAFIAANLAGPPLGSLSEILSKPGLYIDLIHLLFLVFTLWFTSRISIKGKSLNMALNGLTFWIAGDAFDLMDEIFYQPAWMAYYCEDLFVLTGMLLTVISLYKTILRMNAHYSIVNNLSLHDELTQLPNRRYFIETIRKKPSTLQSLIIIDIDHFKKINDTWGHAEGDQVLVGFGRQLSDINDFGIKGYRIGGEEFAVIVDGRHCKDVLSIAESIRTNAQNILVGEAQNLSVSIGIGLRAPGESYNDLMNKVDSALYRAKQKGRNRIEQANSLTD